MWAPAWWVKMIGLPLVVFGVLMWVRVVGWWGGGEWGGGVGRPSCCGLLHAAAAPEVEPEVWMEVREVEEDLMRMMRSRWRTRFFFFCSIHPP